MPVGPLSQPGASGRLPTTPTNISATAVSGVDGPTGSATVSWTASLNPGRATGTYLVRSFETGNIAGPTASVSAASTSVSVTGLTIGKDYTFTVELLSPYGLNSGQSSATPSAIRAFRRPTIAASTKGAGTAVAVSSSSHSGKDNTWTTTIGSTTASATNGRSLSFSKVSGAGTQTLTQSGDDLNITGMSINSSYVFRATWINSRASGVRITTSVNPEGRATTVSLSWGYSSNYTTYTATSGGSATVNIGSGSSAVTTEWVIEDSGGSDRVNTETLYFRVTATNSVDTARTSDDTHTTVATSTYTTDTASLKTQQNYSFTYTTDGSWTRSTYKDSYHVAPELSNIVIVAGGGGGGNAADSMAGGGGGGNRDIIGDFAPAGNLLIYVGAGGSGYGGTGGSSSIYDLSTNSNRGSVDGGTGGGSGTSSANGGSVGNGGNSGGSSATGGGYYYWGGGGGGKGGAGGNGNPNAASLSDRPGAGGTGSSGTCSGGGGSGQEFFLTNPPFGGEWRYQGAPGGANGGGGAGGGAGGTSITLASSGTANTGGGGGGLATGGVPAGNGGSGFVSFSFNGK